MYQIPASILVLLISSTEVAAWFKIPCNTPLVVERIDPIVSPGFVGGHVHTVNGGSNFGVNSSSADLRASKCTSCSVREDLSVYWTPELYIQYSNGTFKSVQQSGPVNISYLFRTNPKDSGKLTAFPDALKMLVGTPSSRSYNSSSLMSQGIGFKCVTSNGSVRTPGLPASCAGTLVGELKFPSCWNGVDSDSTDHISHMAYPLVNENGTCPALFPVRVPTLFFETSWATDLFNKSQAKNPTQPFVLASGDPTGFAYHGDFENGWKNRKQFQTALDTCTNNSGSLSDCSALTLVPSNLGTCQKTSDVNEVVLGNLVTLPGCNLVSNTTASKVTDCPTYVAPGLLSNATVFFGPNSPPSAAAASPPSVRDSGRALSPPPPPPSSSNSRAAGTPPPPPPPGHNRVRGKRNVIRFDV